MDQHQQPHESLGAEAFAIFEKRLASEIASENNRIEKNIKLRSKPLYTHINSTELRTADGYIVIPFEGLDKSEPIPGGRQIKCKRLDLPGPVIFDIPLSKLARDEGTKLYVSNQCAGNFPQVLSNPQISDINVEEKSFTMRILDDGGFAALFGRVTNLSDEDFESLLDDPGYTMGAMLQMEDGWQFSSPDAKFLPTHVSILILDNGHPGVFKTLHTIRDSASSRNESDGEGGEVNDQRNLVFSVTNDPHNIKLLENHRKLKLEQKKLDDIQDVIESVEISDDDGNTYSKLMSSAIGLADDGFTILLLSECNFIGMSDWHAMKLTVSGVRLRKAEGSFTPYDNDMGAQISIEYDTGVSVIGFLHLGKNLGEAELRVMNEEVLPSIIQDVLGGRQSRLRFPDDAFCLRSVHFKANWVDILGKIHGLVPPMMLDLKL